MSACIASILVSERLSVNLTRRSERSEHSILVGERAGVAIRPTPLRVSRSLYSVGPRSGPEQSIYVTLTNSTTEGHEVDRSD